MQSSKPVKWDDYSEENKRIREEAERRMKEAFNMAIEALKAQEHPTDASISSAIECLLHPQDADDSDMAKAIDTAVRTMRLLKAQEPVEPLRIKHDTKWQQDIECICGECGGSFYRLKVNFCPWCGRAVKWE